MKRVQLLRLRGSLTLDPINIEKLKEENRIAQEAREKELQDEITNQKRIAENIANMAASEVQRLEHEKNKVISNSYSEIERIRQDYLQTQIDMKADILDEVNRDILNVTWEDTTSEEGSVMSVLTPVSTPPVSPRIISPSPVRKSPTISQPQHHLSPTPTIEVKKKAATRKSVPTKKKDPVKWR